MAEAIFKHQVKELGYAKYFDRIDSFGTSGWHRGDSPDHRSAKTCKKHGVPIKHASQQISPKDFKDFDYVIGMDKSNVEDLLFMKPRDSKTRVALFGEWRKDERFQVIVDDPYYGGINGFETNFQQICHFSREFLEQEIGKLD